MSDTKIGDVIFGRYKVAEPIGEGGQAFVFKGTDQTDGKKVVIKQLKTADELKVGKEEYKDLLKRFINESTLNLPNEHIVKNYQCGEERGLHYNVMEYIDGDDLEKEMKWVDDIERDIHKAEEILPEDEARNFIAQIAEGLECAHANNVIHRDIKPANIMIRNEDKFVKVMDFGIACFKTKERKTELGALLGSWYWMSPEQALEPRDVDCQTDIWSLGVVFYQVTTGYYPFSESTLVDMIKSILSKNPVSPRELNPSLSEGTEKIILRMLEKDCSKRFRTMTEIRQALGYGPPALPRNCPRCGAETKRKNRFCTSCGYDLVELPLKLVCTGGCHAGMQFPVKGDMVKVGRSRENDIILGYDGYISRWHLRIHKEVTGYTVVAWDWKNKKKPSNETILNGVNINGKGSMAIRVGDKLRLGGSWFEVMAD